MCVTLTYIYMYKNILYEFIYFKLLTILYRKKHQRERNKNNSNRQKNPDNIRQSDSNIAENPDEVS